MPNGRTGVAPDALAIVGSSRRFPLARSLRPRQWLKNVLVFAAPLAAGSLLTWPTAGKACVACVAFCLMSGSVYLVNDVLDAPNDRLHPEKRRRPVAAGEVSARVAVLTAVLVAGAAFGVSLLASWQLALVLACYLASSLAYSLGVKREPVFDLALVALGFLLRAVAGGVATGVPLSEWFLLVASFGSLFMVAGKRYADVLHASSRSGDGWDVVSYSPSYLRFVWGLAASATVLGYALWAFQVGALRHEPGWAQLSVAPFVLAVLRYAVDIDRGAAGAPEDVVLGDRWLIVLAVLWVALFAAAADAG
jgi:decaprenyl-phosphate phosphoribosyltransferase